MERGRERKEEKMKGKREGKRGKTENSVLKMKYCKAEEDFFLHDVKGKNRMCCF